MRQLYSMVAALVVLLLVSTSCSFLKLGGKSPPWPAEIMSALEKASSNRPELEKVLRHYRTAGDSLKLQAAYYLIENMDGHSFVNFSLRDSAEVEIDFNILDYPDYKTARAAIDEIEAARGELDYKRKEILEDLETIQAGLLIENIELAFHAWRGKPWAQNLSFADFCDYVLPYRGSSEPLESWRPHFLNFYADLAGQMEDPTDPIEAAGLINTDLKSWFKFDPRYYLHPTDQGLAEMLDKKMGRCEDMTNLTIYAMRANGLAVTSDYTPFWANAGNNHAWNAILSRDGKVIMFMGAEANPGHYRLANRTAKVYRKTYARQPQNLAFQKEEWEEVPGWLRGKNYLDVTSDYQEVIDVTLKLPAPVPDSVSFAYLCVFNSGEWKAVHWGRIQEDRATFTAMGKGIACLPAYYVDKELQPTGPAFILEENGEVRELVACEEVPGTLKLISTKRRAAAKSTDATQNVFLESAVQYELFYWKDDWISVGEAVMGDDPLEFSGVPQGALYWLVAEGSRKDERIFTYEQGTQVWW